MTEELQELELLEDAPDAQDESAAAPSPDMLPPGAMPMTAGASGVMPAPVFNPAADKEYYRFFLAGLVMFIGCLMPWGTDAWEGAGYYTLGGALTMVLAILIMWSWWRAIATRSFVGGGLKWVFLAAVPLIFQLMGALAAFDQPEIQALTEQAAVEARADAIDAADPDAVPSGNIPDGWGAFFGQMFDFKNPRAQEGAARFIATYGTGRVMVLLGALLAELFLLLAVFGGVKTAKAQKAARQAEAAAARGSRGGGGRRRGS